MYMHISQLQYWCYFNCINFAMHVVMQNGENPLLKAAVTAIGEHDALWQRYWKDFLANQFHLNAGEDKLTFELINFTLARPLARKDVKMKLVILHCMARTNQINLTKLMSGLRPLQMLQTAVETTLVPTISPVSPMTTLMSMVDQDKKNVDNPVVLYQFIIDTLFGALAEEIMYCKLEKLHVWRECYRDVVCTCVHLCGSLYCICCVHRMCVFAVHYVSMGHKDI